MKGGKVETELLLSNPFLFLFFEVITVVQLYDAW